MDATAVTIDGKAVPAKGRADASRRAAPNWWSWRRLLRFRLLTLLLLVTAICVALGMAYQRVPITKDNLDRLRVVLQSPLEVHEFQVAPSGREMAFVGWEAP